MTSTAVIVGAGPSGCYVAQALRKSCPELEITILDRLPVPYGLVRYGVAPDHQGTKAVISQFSRLFERQNISFAGNLELGEDIDLVALREMFDIVVLATGLSQDRSLGPDFDSLPNVLGSGAVTRAWNGHPDAGGTLPSFGRKVVVIGNGNVAMDIVRLLAKGHGDFDGSDISGPVLCDTVAEIHLVGRSPADKAKFDPQMVRELGDIDSLVSVLHETSQIPEADTPVVRALCDLVSQDQGTASIRLHLHFQWNVTGPIIDNGALDGIMLGREDGEVLELTCDSLVTAIGFEDDGTLARADLMAQCDDSGRIGEGLYATGWFRRGPQGTIATNRADAKTVAAKITEDLKTTPRQGAPGHAALREQFADKMVTYADWQVIDAAERAQAAPNRVRAKLTRYEDMMSTLSKVGDE